MKGQASKNRQPNRIAQGRRGIIEHTWRVVKVQPGGNWRNEKGGMVGRGVQKLGERRK